MEGRPINPFGDPEHVLYNPNHLLVGRQTFGGDDVGLNSKRKMQALAEALTGAKVEKLPLRNFLRGTNGDFGVTPSGKSRIRIGPVHDEVYLNTLSHELGHAIALRALAAEKVAGSLGPGDVWPNLYSHANAAAQDQMREIYHASSPRYGTWNPHHDYNAVDLPIERAPSHYMGLSQEMWDRPGYIGPSERSSSYGPTNSATELDAENLRNYMRHPGAYKKLAPDAAAHIRAMVNSSPAARWIQFNALPLAAGGGMGAALAAAAPGQARAQEAGRLHEQQAQEYRGR